MKKPVKKPMNGSTANPNIVISDDIIRKRAYELSLNNGNKDPLHNWLKAESELKNKTSH